MDLDDCLESRRRSWRPGVGQAQGKFMSSAIDLQALRPIPKAGSIEINKVSVGEGVCAPEIE